MTDVVVNATTDAADAVPGDGRCDTGGTNSLGDPACTLRAAIQEANALGAASTIEFAIPDGEPGYNGLGPGASYWTIQPATSLPTVTAAGVSIDGDTQTAHAAAVGFDHNGTAPSVELDGSVAGADGLHVTGGSSTIRGLVINRFDTGLRLSGGDANTVVGNMIGPDATGQAGLVGNTTQGILIEQSASNTIGGVNAADRNVISGNRLRGIAVDDWSDGAAVTSAGTRIVGNYIGTTADGTAALPHAAATFQEIGIYLLDSGAAVVGEPGAGNVLSGNDWYGIYVWTSNGTAHTIQGNIIGLDATASASVGNGADDPVTRGGIFLSDAVGTIIGGAAAGEGNTIAGNDAKGVLVLGGSAQDNTIVGNELRDNVGVGIDLGTDGVTANDAGDADIGPNDLLNFPAITAVQRVAGDLVVDLELDVPAGDYRIELFGNTSAHAKRAWRGRNPAGRPDRHPDRQWRRDVPDHGDLGCHDPHGDDDRGPGWWQLRLDLGVLPRGAVPRSRHRQLDRRRRRCGHR